MNDLNNGVGTFCTKKVFGLQTYMFEVAVVQALVLVVPSIVALVIALKVALVVALVVTCIKLKHVGTIQTQQCKHNNVGTIQT